MRSFTALAVCAARLDGRVECADGGIVRSACGDQERIAPRRECCERTRDSAADLPGPFRRVDGARRIEPLDVVAVVRGMRDLRGGDGRAGAGDAGDALDAGKAQIGLAVGNQARRPPIGDQGLLDTLRAGDKETFAAIFPDQAAGFDQRCLVEHVERDDLGASAPRAHQRQIRAAIGHGDEVDQSDRSRRLFCKMPAEIGLVHRRHWMTRHGRVPVETMADAIHGREQMAEHLIAAHRRRSHEQRMPASAELRHGEIDRTPDRADLRRGVEGRAHLVVCDRRADTCEHRESRRQVLLHPGRILRRAPCRRCRCRGTAR